MRWKGRQQSSNIEDRRVSAGKKCSRQSSVGGIKIGSIGFFVMLLINLCTGQGQNFMAIMGDVSQVSSGTANTSNKNTARSAIDEGGEFVSIILKDTESF